MIGASHGQPGVTLRELFSRHAPWLAIRLRSLLPATDTEDVLQETFLAVWQGARGYRPGSAGGWLWGIARRQAALFVRRRGPATSELPGLLAIDGSDGDPAEAALSGVARPLIARNPAFGLSASRRAAISLAGRPVRRAIRRAPAMVSHGPMVTRPTRPVSGRTRG